VAARGAAATLDALPDATAIRLGAALGRGCARLDTHLRRLALANLKLIFPEHSDAQRRELLDRNFAELGRIAAEWARLPSLPEAQVLSQVQFEGLQNLEAALARGRGALVVTAHFGYWELILRAIGVALPSAEITAVGRAQPNPALQRMVEQRRALGDSRPVPQDARSILRALRRNAAVGVLADHYLSKRHGGVLAPFLGLRAWSNPGPATLALRSGCPLLVAHARRLPDGRHRIQIDPELDRPASGDRARDIAALTEHINDAISQWVRATPHAWLWATRRFRGSPDAPSQLYAPRRRRRPA
jgi:KDO2-lipid IV(A) lauroyltransferase